MRLQLTQHATQAALRAIQLWRWRGCSQLGRFWGLSIRAPVSPSWPQGPGAAMALRRSEESSGTAKPLASTPSSSMQLWSLACAIRSQNIADVGVDTRVDLTPGF